MSAEPFRGEGSFSPGFWPLPGDRTDLVVQEDDREIRRVTFKLCPKRNRRSEVNRGLWEKLALHKDLYNGALEHRIWAWRSQGKSISFAEQCAELTQVRAEIPEYRKLNCTSSQQTLRRLDKAFKAFFRRCASGGTPGFPRFKSKERFPGWGYGAGDGFEFEPGPDWRNGRVRVEELGWIPVRGKARTPGEEILGMDVLRKADGWFVSVVVRCRPAREVEGDRVSMSLDWGVESFLTICSEDKEGRFHAGDVDAGRIEVVENPRIGKAGQEKVDRRRRDMAKAPRGSRRRRKERRCLAKELRHQANQRKDFQEKASAGLVARAHTLVTESLGVKGMTASAKGTVEEPGTNVAQKAGLNREILDTRPRAFFDRLWTKAEEAGSMKVEWDARTSAPSQHCVCGERAEKELSERTHECPACGRKEGRDAMSSRYLLALFYGHVSPARKAKRGRNPKPKPEPAAPAAEGCPASSSPPPPASRSKKTRPACRASRGRKPT